jgi:hypothetical protein
MSTNSAIEEQEGDEWWFGTTPTCHTAPQETGGVEAESGGRTPTRSQTVAGPAAFPGRHMAHQALVAGAIRTVIGIRQLCTIMPSLDVLADGAERHAAVTQK